MVYISELLVSQIKEAESAQRVKLIIEDSLSNFKGRPGNGHIEKKYTRNILMALKYYREHELETKHIVNINIAIDIFEKLHAQGKESLL
jgi:hypothetical protein